MSEATVTLPGDGVATAGVDGNQTGGAGDDELSPQDELVKCAHLGDIEAVEALWADHADGLDLDAPSQAIRTVLFPLENVDVTPLQAAATNGKLDMVTWLINHGASVDCRNSEGAFTALHGAARANEPEVIRYLTTEASAGGGGAAIDPRNNKDWWTPLTFAVIHHNAEAVEALLACGADPMIKTENDDTVRDLAEELGGDEILALIDAALVSASAEASEAAEAAPAAATTTDEGEAATADGTR